jgi:hypothetical protein
MVPPSIGVQTRSNPLPPGTAASDISSTEWAVVDATLSKLLQDPDSSVDPDSIAPSPTSIRVAMRLSALLKFLGDDLPSAVVPDGSGGMIFEWQSGPTSRWLEIADTGAMEHVLIRDGQRVFRRTFDLGI